jgi:hypothetical protein
MAVARIWLTGRCAAVKREGWKVALLLHADILAALAVDPNDVPLPSSGSDLRTSASGQAEQAAYPSCSDRAQVCSGIGVRQAVGSHFTTAPPVTYTR